MASTNIRILCGLLLFTTLHDGSNNHNIDGFTQDGGLFGEHHVFVMRYRNPLPSYMHVCIYIYIYVYTYIYVYIYIYTHAYIHIYILRAQAASEETPADPRKQRGTMADFRHFIVFFGAETLPH